MNAVSNAYSKLRARRAHNRARRERNALITRIGELTYVQRMEPSAEYETAVEELVEEVRHLERLEELRQRRDIAGG